jgi:DNA-directed RNA polymerase specialized sigma24 family protein
MSYKHSDAKTEIIYKNGEIDRLPERYLEIEEQAQINLAILTHLTPRQRELVFKVLVTDLTVAQAASEMGITLPAAMQLIENIEAKRKAMTENAETF